LERFTLPDIRVNAGTVGALMGSQLLLLLMVVVVIKMRRPSVGIPVAMAMAIAALVTNLGGATAVQVVPPAVVHPSEGRKGADGEPNEA
jgi:hypothetical protein